MPWTVALTGGIGAGKTAVSRQFEALGVHVHDADTAARVVVAPGTPGLDAIVAAFGRGVLRRDGHLDRGAVRDLVFADTPARQKLEAIMHPRIHAWLRARVDADPGPWCMLAIPLLAETWPKYRWVDRILLVEAALPLRISRLMQRDGIDANAAQRMIAAQASDTARRTLADDIIDNSGTEETLGKQVRRLYERYGDLAASNGRRQR